ncbi:S8 family peptidase [Flavobacterium sp.]|uniref:S8 family peptidase n=1 Tax=Flavobacterium sp. TaxID=239 RepID=UPI002B4B0685|nr:S8 family peptidase [Flavobacterium sp.]HLF51480.1 S8 family peptidase [Flavobacterium sp.]
MLGKKGMFVLIGFFSFMCSAYAQQEIGAFNLYIAFDLSFDFTTSKSYDTIVLSQISEYDKIQKEYKINLSKGISISDEKLDFLANSAIAISGSDVSVRKLSNIFKVSIENPTRERLLTLAEQLKTLKGVEYASLMASSPIQPPNDIAPATANFEPSQTYINANPGVNMKYAWNLGFNGSGIRIRDIEYGFNNNHEELVGRNVSVFPGMTVSSSASLSYTEHGTAAIGIMYADKGAYGISGMANGASELIVFPEWQQIGYDRVIAVSAAIQNSVAGDVVLYEMQTYGAQGNFCAAEYDFPIWSLTKAATDAGIVVVAAAGNGSENLDSVPYAPYRNRGDSGAIIVGAGKASTTHDRINYSTYGTRVDVQGWGQNVRTCGYGDLVTIGGDFNQGYTNFAGTSSAASIVASCSVVLQSYYHELSGNYLTSPQMRYILKQTGIPQGSNVLGNIGPLPNMQNAIIKIFNDYTLSIDDFDSNQFVIYPNPVQDKMQVLINNQFLNPKIEIYSGIGQLLNTYFGIPGENTINLSSFPNGFYIVKLVEGEKVYVKKVIKK